MNLNKIKFFQRIYTKKKIWANFHYYAYSIQSVSDNLGSLFISFDLCFTCLNQKSHTHTHTQSVFHFC